MGCASGSSRSRRRGRTSGSVRTASRAARTSATSSGTRLPFPPDERRSGRQLIAGGDHGADRQREIRRRRRRSDPRSSQLQRRRAKWTAVSREFEFSAAAQALYGFFWNDFCDWYVEVSKSKFAVARTMKANCLAIQDLVLRQTLLLLHPFIPFITEELWQLLGYGAAGHVYRRTRGCGKRLSAGDRPQPGAAAVVLDHRRQIGVVQAT